MEGLLFTVYDGVNVGVNRAHERVECLPAPGVETSPRPEGLPFAPRHR